jgi:hypothetical protein
MGISPTMGIFTDIYQLWRYKHCLNMAIGKLPFFVDDSPVKTSHNGDNDRSMGFQQFYGD